MTKDEKKEYLNSYILRRRRIARLLEQQQAEPLLPAKFIKEIAEEEDALSKTEAAVKAVDGAVLSEVLAEKYLCGKTIEQTAHSLNYSVRHTSRLHQKALEMFRPL